MSFDAERLEGLRALRTATSRPADLLAVAMDSDDDDDAIKRVADLLGVSAGAARMVINQQFRSLTRQARARIAAEEAQLAERVHGADQ